MMNVAVLGLWHLGCVTAACVAKHAQVTGVDFDPDTVAGLAAGRPPLFEPGLAELIRERTNAGTLRFTAGPEAACREAALLWVCHDTPVDDDDAADLTPIFEGI